jgi:uncharacterized protein YkwD
MKQLFIPALLIIITGFTSIEKGAFLKASLSQEEQKLYDLIMEYRKSKNLPPIPLSLKLTKVAQTHARDLNINYKFDFDNKCNPHSWSKKGKWSACCYTNDHKQAKCMWDKPREIAGYSSNGYEIAYYSSKGATAEEGLAGWKLSPGHNPLIINEGTWSKVSWKGIGIGIVGEYGIVWFGEIEDDFVPAQAPSKPNTSRPRSGNL